VQVEKSVILLINTSVCLIEMQGKGFCFRLYTEEAFSSMAVSAEPEIRRCSLTSSMLQLKCVGQDMEELDFMDKPDEESSMQWTSYRSLRNHY
jgi:hypothetical protein